MRERFERLRAQMGAGNGGGPTGDDMEQRITALEKSVEKMDAKLDRLIEGIGEIRTDLARIQERLEAKAGATDVA